MPNVNKATSASLAYRSERRSIVQRRISLQSKADKYMHYNSGEFECMK
jgi:hypothetical protein